MCGNAPKGQFAAQAHQRLLRMWQEVSLRHLQFLIQRGKNRLHTAGRSHSCVPLPPLALPASATSVSLVRGLAGVVHTAHTPIPGSPHSRLRRWLELLVRSSALAVDSSAHRRPVQSRPASLSGVLLSTAPRLQRCPRLVLPNAFVSLRVAWCLSLFWTLWTTLFLCVSLPSLAS